MAQCTTKTKAGKRCRNDAHYDDGFCGLHHRQAAGEKLPGRPTLFTDETRGAIMLAIESGAYIETAVAYAGIAKDTFYGWMRQASKALREADGDPDAVPEDARPFVEFADTIGQAMARVEVADLAHLRNVGRSQDWRALTWRLERRHPERWTQRQYLEHSGVDGGPIQIDEHEPDPERDSRVAAILAHVGALGPVLGISPASDGDDVEGGAGPGEEPPPEVDPVHPPGAD